MHETSGSAPSPSVGRTRWLIPAALIVVVAIGAAAYFAKSPSHSAARGGDEAKTPEISNAVHVEVVHPRKGQLERVTAQAGTAMAFEWVDIYAEVPGYLRTRKVDIGSVVKKDDLLAEIDVPDLSARLEQQKAEWKLAQSRVQQKTAALVSARAELKAVESKIRAAQARRNSDKAYLVFRTTQAKRYQELLKTQSIDARLVDEQEDRREAAFESLNASEEAVNAAVAQKESAAAKIEQAKADIDEAEAYKDVTKAELDRAGVMVDFATIKAKFDGVITYRDQGFNPGAFIRAATGGNTGGPLLTLQHVETIRFVVPIPDRDVPYCQPGVSSSVIVFDALPNEKFTYNISRIAGSEDLLTKTMRCEIDIPNPKRIIRQGMYGLATITLKKIPNALSISSACLAGKAEHGVASVYVVRDGKAKHVSIKTGLDNGIEVEVVDGLKPDDVVVLNPSGDVADDVAVVAADAKSRAASGQ